jgi:hypothetical protein
MSTHTSHTTLAPGVHPAEPIRIRAHNRSVKKLGQWTTQRHFDVAASRGSVVLDLLVPRIGPGEIDIHCDLNHAVVKLLVPDGANIDHDDLRRIGRGRVKDWTGASAPDGRQIKLRGELRDAEIRIHRGGVAILSLLVSRTSRKAVRHAHRDGLLTG